MDRAFPWEWAAAAAALVAVLIAIRYPRSRRWIAALVVLCVFGVAAIVVLMIGAISRLDVGGSMPAEAAIGSAALAITGLVLAGLIAFLRRQSAES